MNTGILYCVTAYVVWGVLPIYWKQLEAVPADQLALHRIVWSFVFLLIVLAIKGEFTALRQEARGWRVFAVYTISSVVILANWMTYIWAPRHFITPLINVIIGVVVFKEKLRLWQWLAIGAAFAGVLVVAIAYGKFPWVALTLAISFSIYGVVKKQAPLNALHGMTVETGILFVPAVIYLSVVQAKGDGAFLHVSTTDNILIVGAGIVTVVPLLMYASAAQKIPFSLLGMLQYIAPSLMFIMGVAVYNEAFSLVKLIGFILVWVALAVYSVEGFVFQKQQQQQVVKPAAVASPRGDEAAYERV
ncbi:RarD protein [Saprolegnia parasitica CBS 223.65]|uniref:RarD protein n=1 Tax=Saprolegnia parasitica (strain CBS 223.65) TaxID=695850 RepID=A0A067CQ04_SAPPC|nr:RarD protein [Saprolegnia parasitica CBS 223.65]KDO28606.1 RarD protein [Saprolegnia parasitica CBS 223.65]|eukprot:XP_012200669.1 RarD protein [Saprolegnia parasitica CBS 223.65]